MSRFTHLEVGRWDNLILPPEQHLEPFAEFGAAYRLSQ